MDWSIVGKKVCIDMLYIYRVAKTSSQADPW